MRYITNLMLLTLLIFGAIGCNKDEITGEGDVVTVPAQINAVSQTEWVLNRPAEGENPNLFRLTWDKARFNYENGIYQYVPEVNYTLEMDLLDNNFSRPVVVTTTSVLYYDFNTLETKALIDQVVGEETNMLHNFSFRVKTSTQYGEAYSQPFTITFTSYLNTVPAVQHIYVIGDMNGWNNTSREYIAFRNSNDPADGKYTYTGYFPSATYFKFCAEEFLGSFDKMYSLENGVLKQGDFGAFYVDPGYYTIDFNIFDGSWSITTYDGSAVPTYTTLGPIGGFCGWDNEPAMTQSAFDPHQWHISYTFDASTACKFRGDHDWSKNWGGQDGEIPYGHGVFDGPGATISEAGTYDIYFNDLTGHYTIKKN